MIDVSDEITFLKQLYKTAEKFSASEFFADAPFVKEFDFSNEKLANFNPAIPPMKMTGEGFSAQKFNPAKMPQSFEIPSMDVKPEGQKSLSNVSTKLPSNPNGNNGLLTRGNNE